MTGSGCWSQRRSRKASAELLDDPAVVKLGAGPAKSKAVSKLKRILGGLE